MNEEDNERAAEKKTESKVKLAKTLLVPLMLNYATMRIVIKHLAIILVMNICLYKSSVSSFGLNSGQKKTKANTLPTLDLKSKQYVPPPNLSSSQFYSPISSMIKAGPVAALTRLFQPKEYEQAVWKYMLEYKETNVKQAQGNMDAFFASRENWVEQKLLEKQGKREVYDYGQEPTLDRVVLATVWGAMSTSIILRATWQLVHGNRNFF